VTLWCNLVRLVGVSQLLVEIPAGEHDVLDLSGDAGAVGRLSMATGSNDGTGMLLDLKGVAYNAALVAMPCTACVVSLGQKEAKVCPDADCVGCLDLMPFV
jgi:hypothetical protein